jgi:hypothetical protein
MQFSRRVADEPDKLYPKDGDSRFQTTRCHIKEDRILCNLSVPVRNTRISALSNRLVWIRQETPQSTNPIITTPLNTFNHSTEISTFMWRQKFPSGYRLIFSVISSPSPWVMLYGQPIIQLRVTQDETELLFHEDWQKVPPKCQSLSTSVISQKTVPSVHTTWVPQI